MTSSYFMNLHGTYRHMSLKKICISYRDEFSRCCQKAEVRPVADDEPHYNCITQADRRLTSQDRFCPACEEKKGEGNR